MNRVNIKTAPQNSYFTPVILLGGGSSKIQVVSELSRWEVEELERLYTLGGGSVGKALDM